MKCFLFPALMLSLCSLLPGQNPRGGAEQSTDTLRQYLSGSERGDAQDWDFRCSSGARAGQWAKLPVPSNWELHGFGTYAYADQPQNVVGEYRHSFLLPDGFRGHRIFIVFDGSMTDTRVRINGVSAGPAHQGGYYRFRYEITDIVKQDADNLLEVEVAEQSSNESVNRAERMGDYWKFGGIFRPVYLEALPAQFVERMALDAKASGSIDIDAFVNGSGDADTLVAQVYGSDAKPLGQTFSSPLKNGAAHLKGFLPSPKTWSAENPVLYSVELRLQAHGKLLHRTTERFGFRTFEVRPGDGLYLNGRRIVLQGVNRHSFRPESGRCLGDSDHREDIMLMKEMNMNAVRMSHYPPDKRFLDLCDELGLYVLDELAGWQKAYDTAIGKTLVEEMVKRDANHPSILFWDNGNEGGWNTELDSEFGRWDLQNRSVLHPWEVASGLNTAHYRVYNQVVSHAQGLMTPRHYTPGEATTRPVVPYIYMPTEFMHSLYDGGAGAGLEDYWTLLRSSPYLGGGFIWALLDEGVRRSDTGRIDVNGNTAPDGILGPHREKEGSFFTIKELWAPIAVLPETLPENFNGSFEVENRYSFTNLSDCRFVMEVRRVPEPIDRRIKQQANSVIIMKGPSIAPGEKGVLKMNMPLTWKEASVLALRAEDPRGKEIWTWTWPLPGLQKTAQASLDRKATIAGASFTQTPECIVVKSERVELAFNRSNGRLESVSQDGHRIPFGNGPRLVAGQAVMQNLSVRQEGPDVLLEASYQGQLSRVLWRVRANGWVDCSYSYTAEKPEPCLGVLFDLPADQVRSKTWVGEGPYRVWQNRLRGVALGFWTQNYNDTVTGWSGWDYPEFKGFFAGVRWITLETTQGRVTAIPGDPALFTQVLTPGLPPVELQKNTAIKVPDAGLGFLHVIPAVGAKFTAPEMLGPQSQIPPLREHYDGRVSFHFDR
jgi:hypothetical protein